VFPMGGLPQYFLNKNIYYVQFLHVDGSTQLPDVVNVDSIWVDLVLWLVIFRGIATTIAAYMNDGFYCNRFMSNMFFLLIVELFEYLHQHKYMFLHWCANITGEFCAHFIDGRCSRCQWHYNMHKQSLLQMWCYNRWGFF
jgi:hypothetical protein